ncbi:MAG: asparagine synthase-related protein [Chloroflexi bacterium]|nr:asparagine synthase-related protein [Chloroflexota bacterium]
MGTTGRRSSKKSAPTFGKRSGFASNPLPALPLILKSRKTAPIVPQWRLNDVELYRLSLSLPAAYRCFPYRGQKVTKPALRSAFTDRLPPSVLRRLWFIWMSSLTQQFSIRYPSVLRSLLEDDSLLQADGFVNRDRLEAVLADRQLTRLNAHALLASAMTELFLRGLHSAGLNYQWR